MNDVERIAEICNKESAVPVVLRSYRVRDYEPVFSLIEYLSMHGVKNRYFIEIRGYSSQMLRDGFDKRLALELAVISGDGDSLRNIGPLQEFNNYKGPYFVVEFSGHSVDSARSINLGKIYQAWEDSPKMKF